MEIWKVVIFCLLALFPGIAILMLTDVKEKIRRRQHPRWYECFDRAKNNAFRAGSEFSQKLDTICARGEMIQDMLFKGECSSEEYLEAMKVLEKERVEAVEQYHLKQDALGIEADLRAADAYAKEYNLKWGIIYE
jgi:predicted Zn-dependent peptidase